MLLEEVHPEMLFDHGAQAHARETEEPPGQLGVEQPAGIQPDLHQAGEVLGGGMDDPFGRCDRLLSAEKSARLPSEGWKACGSISQVPESVRRNCRR